MFSPRLCKNVVSECYNSKRFKISSDLNKTIFLNILRSIFLRKHFMSLVFGYSWFLNIEECISYTCMIKWWWGGDLLTVLKKPFKFDCMYLQTSVPLVYAYIVNVLCIWRTLTHPARIQKKNNDLRFFFQSLT